MNSLLLDRFPTVKGEGRESFSCLLWLLAVSPAADTVAGTQEAPGKSVLKVNALF